MSKLGDLFSTSAEQMRLDLRNLRTASEHRGLKGAGAEELLAEFLRGHLPASIGVTTGQVVDANGNTSKQVDVVIYNAMRTPALFAAPGNAWRQVPAEGVLAVIEVKMKLNSGMLEGLVENCRSVTSLHREAYLPTPIMTKQAPIIYSVFVFEADQSFAVELTDLMATLPTHEQISSVCYLDRGIDTHIAFSGTRVDFSPRPTSVGQLVAVESANALLLWFTSLTTEIFHDQAVGPPIDLLKYARDENSNLQGSLSGLGHEQQIRLIRAAIGGAFGGNVQLAETVFNAVYVEGRNFTPEEAEKIYRAGYVVTRSSEVEARSTGSSS